MPTLQMICLANSRKHQGRCIAGIRADGYGWLRPLGRSDDGALMPHEFRFPTGGEPMLLDIVERPAPSTFAPLVKSYLAPGPLLFGDRSDRIPYDRLAKSPAPASLAVVSPGTLYFRTAISRITGSWQARARFDLYGANYDLGLTDPECERRLSVLPVGNHEPEEIGFPRDARLALTISLGEPFRDGCCYKLVAAAIAIPDSW